MIYTEAMWWVVPMKPARRSLSMVSKSTPLLSASETYQSALWKMTILIGSAFALPIQTLKQGYNGHLILASAVTSASIEISELLIAWGAKIRSGSALTIASNRGRADLVILLLKYGADVNEMGVPSIDDDPKTWKELLCILSEKDGRISCRSCSFMGWMSTKKTI